MNDNEQKVPRKSRNLNMVNIRDEDELQSSPQISPVDYAKMKIGLKTVRDVAVNFGDYQKANPRLSQKEEVLRAIDNLDYLRMREISNYFYRSSGIYSRLCRYMAYMYRYDWLVTPYTSTDKSIKKEKLLKEFNDVLNYLDNFGIKRFCGEVALKVVKNGCYYGYVIHTGERAYVQELPPKYCRSRFTSSDGSALVEFNLRFFDDQFTDKDQRERILGMFPKEFKKAYRLYEEKKLKPDFRGDSSGWYLLEEGSVIKFSLNGEDYPAFISVIPSIIDLDDAKGLDKKKRAQQLLKILIQKMPVDKNGDLVFDVDEAQQLHNNAVQMLSRAIGIDVLTTFADVEVEDLADNSNNTVNDDLSRSERAVYNEAGVSQMQFNTDGNIALEKSILNDEAALYNLIQQFENFLNVLIKPFNKSSKKTFYRVQMLNTTIYNYKDMAKLFKEQTQMGYSKMLPQIALGQSQSSVLATAYFENDVLDLVHVFIPPMTSNQMNAEVLANQDTKEQKKVQSEQKEAGRPELDDDQKSEKTIQNREAMN